MVWWGQPFTWWGVEVVLRKGPCPVVGLPKQGWRFWARESAEATRASITFSKVVLDVQHNRFPNSPHGDTSRPAADKRPTHHRSLPPTDRSRGTSYVPTNVTELSRHRHRGEANTDSSFGKFWGPRPSDDVTTTLPLSSRPLIRSLRRRASLQRSKRQRNGA